MNISKNLRSAFMAAAIATSAILLSATQTEASFGRGRGCRGAQDCTYSLNLVGPSGADYQVDIQTPDKDIEAFRTQAVAVLKDLVNMHGVKFDDLSDQDTSGLKSLLEGVAEDGKMTVDELRKKIGLTDAAYKTISYRAYKINTLYKYNNIKQAARISAPKFIGWELDSNDETIQKVNDAVAAARKLYPNEPAFQVPSLTTGDLQAVRRNAALVLASAGLRLLKEIDAGFADEKTLPKETLYNVVDHIIELLYERQKNEYVFKAGEKYNSEIPAQFDRALTMNGCRDACKDDFYRRIVEIHNYYNRANPMTLPVPKQEPTPAVPKL
jgi:hypothetical protein